MKAIFITVGLHLIARFVRVFFYNGIHFKVHWMNISYTKVLEAII